MRHGSSRRSRRCRSAQDAVCPTGPSLDAPSAWATSAPCGLAMCPLRIRIWTATTEAPSASFQQAVRHHPESLVRPLIVGAGAREARFPLCSCWQRRGARSPPRTHPSRAHDLQRLGAQSGPTTISPVLAGQACQTQLTSGYAVPPPRAQAGDSALHKACLEAHLPCVKLLVEKGADVRALNAVRK